MDWTERIIEHSDPSDREIALLDERPFNLITVIAGPKGEIIVDDRCNLTGDVVDMINPARELATDCWIVYGAYESQADGSVEIDPFMYMDRGYAYLSIYDDVLRGSVRTKVTRYAWVVAHGPIKTGKSITTKCKQVNCIRPIHLKETLGQGSVWERLSIQNLRPTMLAAPVPQDEDSLRALPGPHLYWTGTISGGFGKVSRRRQNWSVRRYLYCCTYGKVPKQGYGGVSPQCDEADCVSPLHCSAIMRGNAPIDSRTLSKLDRYKYLSYSQKDSNWDDLLTRLKGPVRLMGVQGIREAIELGEASTIEAAWGVMIK